MFIEHRTYSLRPGETATYLQRYTEAGGLALQETMAPCVGWYTVEAGDLHRLVTMWRFEDLNQRRAAREQLDANPRWQAMMADVKPLVLDIRSLVLSPASFWSESPRGRAVLAGD